MTRWLNGLAALLLMTPTAACDQGAGTGGVAAQQMTGATATQNQIRQTPRDQVQEGGTFTWPIDSMPPNFNYHQLDGTELTNSQIIGALMPATFDNDAAGTPIWNRDLLAAEPTVTTEPAQVVTYRINPRAAWYDGTPITWEDFYWQWRASNGTDKAYQIGSSNGYEVIGNVAKGQDEREVVVTYKSRY